MTPCPECQAPATVIETKLTVSGRRRRWACTSCQHRYTTWGDELPPRARTRGMSEGQIFDILTSDESSRTLAERLGCSRVAVNRTRLGSLNANVLPELQRWNKRRSCRDCSHWNRKCSLNVRGRHSADHWFARECTQFQQRQEAA